MNEKIKNVSSNASRAPFFDIGVVTLDTVSEL
jgi:hypothetical protein